MARIERPLNQLTAKGLLQDFSGSQVGPDGVLIQNNGSMIFLLSTIISGTTLTILSPRTIDGRPAVSAGPTFTISGSKRRWFGLFDPAIWNQGGASGGVIFVDSTDANASILAFQIG